MIDIIFSFAALLITASYIFRNILLLRLLSIAGAFVYLFGAYFAGYATPGMKAVIFFSVVNIIINAYQSISLIIDKIPILLPDNIKQVYIDSFAMMTTREFAKISKWAVLQIAQKGDVLTTENQYLDSIMVIVKGEALVKKNNKIVSTLKAGFFIGEISFLNHDVANATVEVLTDQFEYLIWKRESLSQLEHSNLPLYVKLKKAIALNLTKKMNISD